MRSSAVLQKVVTSNWWSCHTFWHKL